MPHALIVDHDSNFVVPLAEMIQREGFTTSTAATLDEARTELSRRQPDVLLLEVMLADGSGIELATRRSGDTKVIFMTAHPSIETAVEACRLGASDYLIKPLDFVRLKRVLANINRTRDAKKDIGILPGDLRELGRFGTLNGNAPSMQRVYDLISRVASSEAHVTLQAETGTGKRRAAQTIHALSKRRNKRFVEVDCGDRSPEHFESALLGHEPCSAVGTYGIHKGYIEQANGGTLFLVRYTEMPARAQAALARILETGRVTPLGGGTSRRVSIRVIAATREDPAAAVTAGRLDPGLYHHLKTFPIYLPPLRERKEDIELLAGLFLDQLNREGSTAKEFTHAAIERLHAYSWPGNVRELCKVVHRAFILAEKHLGVETLPPDVIPHVVGPQLEVRVGSSLADMERRAILATLEHCDGDKKKAADMLGISLTTLYHRLNEYKSE
jgi:DNA-binding NtrC family response regulator